MRVVEEQAADQTWNVFRFRRALPECGNDRLKIQRRHSITIVGGGPQCAQHQVQSVGHAVTTDFSLVQLDLAQNRLNLVGIDAGARDSFDTCQHFLLKSRGMLGFAAFDTTAEHHLPHRFLQPAKRRG